jgi:2-polyprenyl-6-methoxyphenol hydroxylase-like FAD-dependent oxidoreductase
MAIYARPLERKELFIRPPARGGRAEQETTDMDTQVLIVGAGPTGLMLANQLGRRGVPAMIIDRHSGPAQQTRAMAVQARTLEIYFALGLAERAIELGRRGNGANMWVNGTWRTRIPLGDIGRSMSPFPYILMLGQDDNERIMGEKLRDWGMAVQWSTELLALDQQPDRVTATLEQPDGTMRRVTAAYVAGCDGGRSAVRELSGITFPGAPYEHVFFVADTEASGPMVPEELNVYLWRDGFHLFFPMRGTDRWRVIGILPRHLRGRDDLTFDDVVPAVREEAGAGVAFKSCSWFSTYRIHHRCAARFRDRRCFLLGDAAHVHSPAGGQGMNTGLQDAYNLAWKLALVVKGQAHVELLDTYEKERIPVAQRLLRTTDRAFMLIVSDSWIARLFRTRIVTRLAGRAMRVERIRKVAFRTISQIGIRYRRSPLSQTLPGVPEGAPLAGDRFPWLRLKFQAQGSVEDLFGKLDDTCFNLLVIGQPAPDAAALGLGDLLHVHHVASNEALNDQALARVGITGPAFYLLRPDGHIALAGTRWQATSVMRYFAERIRIEGSPIPHGMRRTAVDLTEP